VLFWIRTKLCAVIVVIDGFISCENSVSEDMHDYWVANPSKDSWFCSVCSSNVFLQVEIFVP